MVSRAYLPHAEAAFGTAGADAIKVLLNAVKLIYQKCPPERLLGTLTVVVGLNATPLAPAISPLGLVATHRDYDEVGRFLVGVTTGNHSVVEIASDGTFRSMTSSTDFDLKSLANHSIVYRFDPSAERILAKGFEDFVPAISPILLSAFAVPTLHSLEDALQYYDRYIRETKCRLLKNVWVGGVDGPRLWLVNKPEAMMRDSLTQALELLLRDVTVKPEQNTDESRPVDIRISWFGSSAVALIEIKWLGRSVRAPRKPTPGEHHTDYGSPRAQEGADQLSDYMDREVRHSAAISATGYLVVFDARRSAIKGANDPLSAKDATAFEHDELSFDPDPFASRSDMAPPVRFFLAPRRSHFLAA